MESRRFNSAGSTAVTLFGDGEKLLEAYQESEQIIGNYNLHVGANQSPSVSDAP